MTYWVLKLMADDIALRLAIDNDDGETQQTGFNKLSEAENFAATMASDDNGHSYGVVEVKGLFIQIEPTEFPSIGKELDGETGPFVLKTAPEGEGGATVMSVGTVNTRRG